MPPKKRPQAFTPDSPSPAAAPVKNPRTSPAKTPRKNKALKEGEHVQDTHVSVIMAHALEYIGCEDAIPILRDSIDMDAYNQRLVYFWVHIFVIVRNFKLKEQNAMFKKTIRGIVADY
jgi:hypothetical protein